MSQKETRIELKVGALVVLCAVLLVGFLIMLGDFRFGEASTVIVDWRTSVGLREGAPVKVSGMKAGRVESVSFHGGEFDDKIGRPVYVRVELTMEPQLRQSLRADARFYITTVGVLGEKYVEIDPGSSEDLLEEGVIPQGIAPMRLEVMAANVNTVLERTAGILAENETKISDTLTDARASMAAGREAIEEGRKMVVEARQVFQRLSERSMTVLERADTALEKADVALTEYTPGTGETGDNIRRITRSTAHLVHTVDTTIGDGADIRATLTDARRLSNRAREVIDQVGGRAVRVASKAEGLLDSAGEMMETGQGGMTTTFTRVDTLLATVSEILEKVREGEGTIGALLTDREIYDDAREMMRDLKRHPWKFLWKE